jgi:hypothetical protein
LLLDEDISPALVARLACAEVFAQSVPHVGLAGRADHEIWKYAFDHGFAVVTTNARDFIALRESGLSREEQWERIEPVDAYIKNSGDENFPLNKLIEITAVGQLEVRDIP